MIENNILRKKLNKKLNKLKISENKKDKLTSELNYLSNLFIDLYLEKQNEYYK